MADIKFSNQIDMDNPPVQPTNVVRKADLDKALDGLNKNLDESFDGTMKTVKAGDSFTVTNSLGGWEKGSTISDLDDAYYIIKKLLNPLTPPSYVKPALLLTGTQPLFHEIGAYIEPELNPVWIKNDGGVFEEYRLYKDGTEIYSNPVNEYEYTDSIFQLVSNVIYNAQVDYGQGPVKDNSEGEPDPDGRIEAGTSVSNNVIYMPQRKAFFGQLDDDDLPDTSDFIRGLSSSVLNPEHGTSIPVTVSVGGKGMCFAYPAYLPAPSSIIQKKINFDIKESYSYMTIPVEGANGYDVIDYRVYYLIAEFAYPYEESFILSI